jgi:serine/threonine-protein kinase
VASEREASGNAVTRLNAALEGRYRVERWLGEGGMATVYLARDERHNRPVALKVLKPELAAAVGAERFLAEIETTARLRHPHILPLFDSGEADGFLFYVMPYVEGETLQERIDREKQLPVAEAVEIAAAVAAALQTAHEAGVVHRDVKPANILLGAGGPLVADFGIALAVEGAVGATRLTETGLSVGTPHYMSPEQASGDETVGRSSDTFALACVLYHMLVGEPPYTGRTAQAILGKLVAGAPVSATTARRSVPPNVDAAIQKALERLPADRFGEVEDFAKALADPSFRHGPPAEVSASHRRWRAGAVALGVTAAALAVLSTWALTPSGPAAPTLRLSVRLAPEPTVGSFGTMALSTDGSILIYEGPSEEGSHQLWLRRWSESSASPLPGTVTGLHPSFSPDGREVAYMARGTGQRGDRLMVTSIDGGVPRVLHEPIRGYPHWGDDGYVYHMDAETGGISRIPGGGGPVERITERQDGDQSPHFNPRFVAEGGAVLFVVEADDAFHIRTVDLSTRAVRVLVVGGVRPHYTRTGHLVYLTPGGDLTAAPFDASNMALTGAGLPVIRGLDFIRVYSPLVVSENGTLVYARRTGARRYQAVWVDRDGGASPIDPEWRFDPGPGVSLSPDGARLAVTIMGDVTEDVWVKELPQGPLTRLTFGSGQETRPRWTADGRVTYVSVQEGPGAIHALRPDGTGSADLLLSHERQIVEGILSDDGEWVIARVGTSLSVAGLAPGMDIIGIRPERDTEATVLIATEFDERAVMLSPDGRWLAYVSDETGRNEVYVRPFPGVDAGKTTVSVNGGVMPLWSRSGEAIFYVSQGEMVEARISTVPSFGVRSREVLFSMSPFPLSSDYTLYDIAPDDQRFVMLREEETPGRERTRELTLVLNWFEELKERVPR